MIDQYDKRQRSDSILVKSIRIRDRDSAKNELFYTDTVKVLDVISGMYNRQLIVRLNNRFRTFWFIYKLFVSF